MNLALFVAWCPLCFPKHYCANTTRHDNRIEQLLVQLLSFSLIEYHRYSTFLSLGRREEEIIFTFTPSFFLFLRYKKETDWWIFLIHSLVISQLMQLVIRKTILNTVNAVSFVYNPQWNIFHHFFTCNISFKTSWLYLDVADMAIVSW